MKANLSPIELNWGLAELGKKEQPNNLSWKLKLLVFLSLRNGQMKDPV
jgi:hypothetical protein